MTLTKLNCLRMSAVAIACLAASSASLADGMRISGTISCKNVKQEALPHNPGQGSLLLLERFECTNKDRGPTS